MRQAFLILTVVGILWGCVQNMRRSSGFPTPDDLEESKTVPTDSSRAKVIVIGKAEDLVKSSDVIESVKYIPLETSPDALLGYYQNIA
ncbi:MAG: 6-bladed beta-propeller, partial [Bacteroidales bacterium]|nr:6-bladed beta-propeller [Bacteroidales bacterium]